MEGDRGVCPCQAVKGVCDEDDGNNGEVREEGTCGGIGREKIDVEVEKTCSEDVDIVLEDRGD